MDLVRLPNSAVEDEGAPLGLDHGGAQSRRDKIPKTDRSDARGWKIEREIGRARRLELGQRLPKGGRSGLFSGEGATELSTAELEIHRRRLAFFRALNPVPVDHFRIVIIVASGIIIRGLLKRCTREAKVEADLHERRVDSLPPQVVGQVAR